MIAKKQPSLTFVKETHEYRIDGVVVPSVTQVLKASGLSNFDFVDPKLLERNSAFGDAVHAAIQFKCKGTLDEETVDEAIKPYVQSWDNFVEDFQFVPKQNEVQGFHPVYRYAYTIDLLGEINNGGKYAGIAVGDIKTGQPKPSDLIQLGGYKLAVERQRHIFILYLNPEIKPRGYKTVFAINNKKEQGIFLSALSLFNFKKENKLT